MKLKESDEIITTEYIEDFLKNSKSEEIENKLKELKASSKLYKEGSFAGYLDENLSELISKGLK